jgi:hypothetical protein
MSTLNQKGSAALLGLLALSFVLFICAGAFGIWAYSGMQDYKDNTDKKIAAAVESAIKIEDVKKDKEADENEKKPLRTFKGSDTYGGLTIQYPKTWSAQVTQSDNGDPLDGYFHPDVIPGIKPDISYALRVKIVSQNYDVVMKQYEGLITAGTVKSTPFRPTNVPTVLGVKLDGKVEGTKVVRMVLLKLRDKTIKISSESDKFYADFDNIILPNISFTP